MNILDALFAGGGVDPQMAEAMGLDPSQMGQNAGARGLMDFGLNMLQSQQPSWLPQSMGSRFASAMGAGMQGGQSAVDAELKRAMSLQQFRQQKEAAMKKQRMETALQAVFANPETMASLPPQLRTIVSALALSGDTGKAADIVMKAMEQPKKDKVTVGEYEENAAMQLGLNIADPSAWTPEQAKAVATMAMQLRAADKRAGASSTTISTPPMETQGAKDRGSSLVKKFDSLQGAASSAMNRARMFQGLTDILAGSPGGVGEASMADIRSGLRTIGNNMGLSDERLKATIGFDVDKLAPINAGTAIQNLMQLSIRSTAGGEGMPGAMSNQDLKFLADAVPGLNKTPEGRALLSKAQGEIARWNQKVARGALKFQQPGGSISPELDAYILGKDPSDPKSTGIDYNEPIFSAEFRAEIARLSGAAAAAGGSSPARKSVQQRAAELERGGP